MTLYPRVLVVLDPSVAEQKALKRAVQLAKLQDCHLTAFLSIYDFSYEMTTMLSWRIDSRSSPDNIVVIS